MIMVSLKFTVVNKPNNKKQSWKTFLKMKAFAYNLETDYEFENIIFNWFNG